MVNGDFCLAQGGSPTNKDSFWEAAVTGRRLRKFQLGPASFRCQDVSRLQLGKALSRTLVATREA